MPIHAPKPAHTTVTAALTLLLVTGSAQAVLLARGGGLVYDTELDVTWLANANAAAGELSDSRVNQIVTAVGSVAGHALTPADFLKDGHGNYTGQMTWWGAMAWADQLVYYNPAYGVAYSDWRLPRSTAPDPGCSSLSGTVRTDALGFRCSSGELGHLFYTELGGSAQLASASLANGTDPDLLKFTDLHLDFYHYANEAPVCPNLPAADCSVFFSFYSGFQWATMKSQLNFALVVLDGDVALRDTDGDGLVDAVEAASGTDPELPDTDHDGLVDGAGGLIPMSVYPAGIDSNLDGYADGEQDFGTDPANPDTDNDGIADGIEVLQGSNPLDSNANPAHADGDLAPYGNPDGRIDAGDVLIAMKIVSGRLTPGPLEYAHGDMNVDGVIDLSDMVIILRQALE